MSFSVKNWQDEPSTATPINAAALEDLETRLSDYSGGLADNEEVSGDWTFSGDQTFTGNWTAGMARWVAADDKLYIDERETWLNTKDSLLTLHRDASSPQTSHVPVQYIRLEAKHGGLVSQGNAGLVVHHTDQSSVGNKTISGATNASPIVVTTSTAHGYATGDRIIVYGVGGNTAANNAWTITVLSSTTFSLDGSTGNGAYTSGGTATNRGLHYGVKVESNPQVNRGGIATGATNGDDVASFLADNVSGGPGLGFKATEGFYVSQNGSWHAGFTAHNYGDHGIKVIGNYSASSDGNGAALLIDPNTSVWGIDLHSGTYTTGQIRFKNDTGIYARRADDAADVEMMRFNSSNRVQTSTTMEWVNGASVVLGTGAGSSLGSASTQKLGFWGATPVVRQSVSGSRGGNAALASLLTALATAGLITDSSSA